MVIVQRLIINESWVKKKYAPRKGERALVKASDVGYNCFSVRFHGDKSVTANCRPEEWEPSSQPDTIARGSL